MMSLRKFTLREVLFNTCPNRGLPANTNEAITLSHFWYGMLRASQRSQPSCMRHGHTLHNLMLLCCQRLRLLLLCINGSQTILSILFQHPRPGGVARASFWQSGSTFPSPSLMQSQIKRMVSFGSPCGHHTQACTPLP